MISDFVKGNKKDLYPDPIRKGIQLHRQIDSYTDTHPATREAKTIFRAHYRLYSGAFVDVVYDHFLARDAAVFTEDTLYSFSQDVYAALDAHLAWLPDRFAAMFPHMKQHNWLFHYREKGGIEKSFGGLVRRAAYLAESETAYRLFLEHYQLLETCYRHFWTDMRDFAEKCFTELQNDG